MWSGDRSTRSRPRSGADIFPRAQDLPPTGPSPGFAADAPSRHSRNGSAQGMVVRRMGRAKAKPINRVRGGVMGVASAFARGATADKALHPSYELILLCLDPRPFMKTRAAHHS